MKSKKIFNIIILIFLLLLFVKVFSKTIIIHDEAGAGEIVLSYYPLFDNYVVRVDDKYFTVRNKAETEIKYPHLLLYKFYDGDTGGDIYMTFSMTILNWVLVVLFLLIVFLIWYGNMGRDERG